MSVLLLDQCHLHTIAFDVRSHLIRTARRVCASALGVVGTPASVFPICVGTHPCDASLWGDPGHCHGNDVVENKVISFPCTLLKLVLSSALSAPE